MPQRTWFITGISGGFGRLLTEQLLECGGRVAGTSRRLALGSDAYTMIHNALTERFAAPEVQRDLAMSSDFIAPSVD
jgi:GDP-D-mannose dehydratase